MPISVMEPETKSLTLYQAEEHLAVLLEMEGAVTPEMEQAWRVEVQHSLEQTQAKREACAQFILQCEAEAEFCKVEAERIRTRGKHFENTAKRVREYVLDFIMRQGFDAQAKFKKLIGKTTTMSARSNPASVEIIDPEAVPAEFKSIRVQMPLEHWYKLVDAFPNETAGAATSIDIDKRLVKEAIGRGEEVKGADLNLGRFSLQIR